MRWVTHRYLAMHFHPLLPRLLPLLLPLLTGRLGLELQIGQGPLTEVINIGLLLLHPALLAFLFAGNAASAPPQSTRIMTIVIAAKLRDKR